MNNDLDYIPYKSVEEFLQAQKEHGLFVYDKLDSHKKEKILPYVNCLNDIKLKNGMINYKALLDYYTWQDGTPCGKLKQ